MGLRWTFIVLVLFIVLGTVAYFALLSPARMKQIASGVLEGKLGGRVTVGDAHFSLRSCQLVLDDVRLDVRGVGSPASQLLAADRVLVQLDRDAIWKGEFIATRIEVDQPTLTLAEIDGTRQMNYHFLSWEDADEPEPDRPMPLIELRAGVLRNCAWSGGEMVELASTNISGFLKPLDNYPHIYWLKVYETADGRQKEGGVQVTGRIDVEADTVDARVEQLSFDKRFVRFLPSSVRDLWHEMDPVGTLPRVTYSMKPQLGWETLIHVEDLGFYLPALNAGPDRVRLENVSGAFRLTKTGFEIIADKLTIDRLEGEIAALDPAQDRARLERLNKALAQAQKPQITGEIEGMVHSLSGHYDGWHPEAPFNLSLVTEAFDLPEQPSVIYALPDPVQRAFRMIAPSGRLSVTMAMWRGVDGGELDYLGTAKLLTGKGRFERFPYEMSDCRGTISFDREMIKIRNITGRTSGDGSATINGRITLPRVTEDFADGDGFYPGLDLTVTAIDLPFDEKLYDAFKDHYRSAIDMFFDREGYAALRDSGRIVDYDTYNKTELEAARVRRQLFRLDKDKDKAQVAALNEELADINRRLDTPAFELGGRANVSVHVLRKPGAEHHSQATTEVDIEEAQFLFKYFPYPMRVTRGRVRIRPGYVEFDDIHMEGLVGGKGVAKGYVALASSEEGAGHVVPNVSFTGLDLPLAELVYDALPEAQGRWLRRMKLAGNVDVAGRIIADDRRETDIDLLITTRDLVAEPGDGSLPLTDLASELRVTLKTLELRKVEARHPGGTLTLTGAVDWTDPQAMSTEVDGKVVGLDLAAPPFGAIGELVAVDEDWLKFLKAHDVRGRFDAGFRYVRLGDDSEYTVRLMPGPIAFKHDGRPVKLEQMFGAVTVDPVGLHLDGFGGAFDGGRLATTGTIRFDDTRNARLSFECAGQRVTDELKNVLPAALGQLIDTLKIDGQYKINFDEVAIATVTGKPTSSSHIKGAVALKQGRCKLGLDITDFDGRFMVDVKTDADQPRPRFTVDMHGDRLKIGGRQITQLTGTLKSVDGADHLIIPRLRGRMYDGAIGGSGGFDLSDKAYQMRFEMSDVDLDQFIKAGQPANGAAAGPGAQPRAMKGRLSAALDLQGKWTEANGPLARGDILVKDGEMYDLPLSVGLLQIANLSLPLSRAFDRAEISYFIKDGKVVFERIALDSNVEVGDEKYITNLAVRGAGQMDYKTQALDLTLNSSNPGGLDLGALTDLIDGFKNQLVTIHVTGTLDKPVTEVKQFSAITAAWNDVFGNDKK